MVLRGVGYLHMKDYVYHGFVFGDVFLLIKDSCEGSGLSTIESSQDSRSLFFMYFLMKQCCHKSYSLVPGYGMPAVPVG